MKAYELKALLSSLDDGAEVSIDPVLVAKLESAARFRKLYDWFEETDAYGPDWARQQDIDDREQRREETENL